jgi:hypothetical protein
MHSAPIEYKRDGQWYRVTISAHTPDENHEWFSCTYAQERKNDRGRWVEDSFGAQPTALVERFMPQWRAVCALHLCDALGAPMHADANALYFAAGASKRGLFQKYHASNGPCGRSREASLTALAEHLRISTIEAVDIVTHLDAIQDEHFALETLPAQWLRDYVKRECRPRWLREAQAAIMAFGGVK